ncbi:NAD-dependent epimerase/dehydratase family protein [Marinobacter lipolyticus]|uniref:NAD-dependent epimerase/dehydratase family protein n=1 Tax=Marinobacter lipolyticus TaxID=209639 RepID=UPI003A94843B
MAITESNKLPRILVAGCGKLGSSIASLLTDRAEVFGLRRNPDRIPAAIHPLGADLLQADQLNSVIPDQLDAVIYCLTPSSYDEQGYQDAYVNGLNNLLRALSGQTLQRLIFISSTSVYAQDDDSWVDESSPTKPSRFSGQIILTGEKVALDSEFPSTIVRFSGIYGPSRRRFLDAVVAGNMDPVSPGPFSNRIHEVDAAQVVVHLINRSLNRETVEDCYIASDCEPVRLDEVVHWVQAQLPCAAPGGDARKGGRAGSKRCSNQRLLGSGYHFRYPDFRAGYREMIAKRP